MGIEVDLGTSEDHSIVFRGRVYRVDGTFPENDVPKLRLRAYDGTMAMGLRRRNRPFTDASLSDIVNEVAGAHFATIDVSVLGDPTFSGNGIRQDDETDLAFLLRLARAYGCVMYVEPGDGGDTFKFIAQRNIMTAEPQVTLYYGRCDIPHRLLTFQSSTDVSEIRLPRVLSGIDFDTGEPTEVTTAEQTEVGAAEDAYFDENLTALREREPIRAAQLEGLLGAAEATHSSLLTELGESEREPIPTFTTQAELQTRAQNQFSTSLRGMRASGTALGVKDLIARTSVGIEDVGGRFSGTWYLSLVRQIVNREGHQTQFECQR
jgi:phage protein D